MIIEEFMRRNLEYASMTDSLLQAVRKITDKNVSSLVVVDINNTPIGPVTGGIVALNMDWYLIASLWKNWLCRT
jgi:predicted transcriptional regulator